MRIHVLQHSSIKTLGAIEEYARNKNHPLESTRFYETKNSPSIDSFDLLIIMDGPIGVYEYKKNPGSETKKSLSKRQSKQENMC